MRRLDAGSGSWWVVRASWVRDGIVLAALCLMVGGAWAQSTDEGVESQRGAETSEEISAETDLALEDEDLGEAGERRSGKGLEEILVTGRRREEALQNVPVSIRAFDSAELEARQILRLDEIGFGTANLSFDTANGSNRNARIYIRGIGQDDPRTIVDPAIGIYVDEVYIPRAINALFDVVDFERIEVLRGPQGTLYGKNTIGGVINVITKKPGHELGGYVDLNVGSFDLLEFRGAVDLPVRAGWFDDKLFTRVLVATGTEDGYTTNLVDGEHAGDNKLLSVRGSAQLFAREDLVFDLVVDWARQNERSVIGKCELDNPFNIARYVTDNFSGDGAGDRFPDWCVRGQQFGPHQGYAKPLRKTSTDTVGVSFIGNYEPLDWLRVKSITGFRHRWDDATGADLDATPLFYIGSDAAGGTHWSVSEDLNLTFSFWQDRINWIVGGFIFHEQGDETDISDINRQMALGLDPEFSGTAPTYADAEVYPNSVDVVQAATGDLLPGGLPEQAQQCLGIANVPAMSNINCALFGLPPLTGTPAQQVQGDTFWRNAIMWGTGEVNRLRSQQWSNRSYAAYTHVDMEVVPDVILQGGVRYTNEVKERGGVDQRIYFSQIPEITDIPLEIIPPQLPAGSGTTRVVIPQVFDCGTYNITLSDGTPHSYTVDCDRWTPEAGIKWQITDEHMTYFRYAQGWKSGGLRLEALTEQTNNSARFVEPYLPESVDSYEIGVRTQWLDNQLLANLTLFWNDYQNMQVTSLEPNDVGLVTAQINNAEKAVTRGFELEGVYLPTWAEKIPLEASSMIFTAGLGFTDAYYDKFIGTTVVSTFDDMGCDDLVRDSCASDPTNLRVDTFAINSVLAPIGLAPSPVGVPIDKSANKFKNTPRVNVNASATYSFDPTSDTSLGLRLDWSYRSSVYYTTDNAPSLKAPPLHLLNMNITLDVHRTNTQLMIWGKNLTDEVYLSGALSLGQALGANNLYYSKPRTFGLRFIQRF